MKKPVFAICFDVGGTLRYAIGNTVSKHAALEEIKSLIHWEYDLESLEGTLKQREALYREWARRTLIESTEVALWTKYMLPEYPIQWVAENAITLNQLWHNKRSKTIFQDSIETLERLAERGYKLAIISNTTSSIEAPQLLAETGLESLFSCVILSTTFGRRKPHPSLFFSAAQRIGISPENCAYIGNDPARDTIGARQAGYSQVFLMKKIGYDDLENDDENSYHGQSFEIKPDGFISSLSQLLDIFPSVNPTEAPAFKEPLLYDAAFSTMWAVDQKLPFARTFEIGRELGFARFELNHKVTPALYDTYDHNQYYISTVHEPCPQTATYDTLKDEDIAISSLDGTRRNRSLDMVKHSIDLAARLGSRSVVIHPGAIVCDKSRDYELRRLFQLGLKDTSPYQQLLNETVADRQWYIQPHLEQVMKSLEALISFSRGSGVALGLENRYRYYDIPLPDEMALLLSLCDEEWYGFQYDTGHAFALDSLGFVDHSQWLERFSSRMIGVHLHDVKDGITDHQVPGEGDVDFKWLASYIPIQAQRTLEIGPLANLSQIAQGLQYLSEQGCIEKVSGSLSE